VIPEDSRRHSNAFSITRDDGFHAPKLVVFPAGNFARKSVEAKLFTSDSERIMERSKSLAHNRNRVV
jgi:hypothetical protein